MESSPRGGTGDISSDFAIILVTAAQIIYLTFFHKTIAWTTKAPDGSVSRLPMLTDRYSTWLPIPIAASILVIVASFVMIISNSDLFRQIAWVGFCVIGIAVTVSLVAIFPFDFSVIPNAAAADLVPRVVRAFLVLMAIFYGISALVLFAKLQ
jgi:hypothetical protein